MANFNELTAQAEKLGFDHIVLLLTDSRTKATLIRISDLEAFAQGDTVVSSSRAVFDVN